MRTVTGMAKDSAKTGTVHVVVRTVELTLVKWLFYERVRSLPPFPMKVESHGHGPKRTSRAGQLTSRRRVTQQTVTLRYARNTYP